MSGGCEACELGVGWAVEYDDGDGHRWVYNVPTGGDVVEYLATVARISPRAFVVGVHVPAEAVAP